MPEYLNLVKTTNMALWWSADPTGEFIISIQCPTRECDGRNKCTVLEYKKGQGTQSSTIRANS